MKPIDYVIIGVAALVIAGVIAYLSKKKKDGKGGCGCGCSGCPSAGKCGSNGVSGEPVSKKTEEENENK